jgi:hypothetical protein
MTMHSNMSIRRLLGVLVTAVAISGYPAFAMAFQNPLPADAGVDEILVRIRIGSANAVNAIIPSVIAALVGFFTRADRNLPLNAIASIEEKL